MRSPTFLFLLPAAALLLLCACQTPPRDLSDGAMVRGGYGMPTTYDGSTVTPHEGRIDSSTVVRDGHGNVVVLPGTKFGDQNANYVDAKELKLKIRELAEQLVADMRDCSLQGIVALPTSFVNLNDFNQTSAFGRLVGEQLFHELYQRGYPVREYRIPGSIRMKPRQGEFYLSRELGSLSARSGVVIVGTYSSAPDAVFVNARLVRPKDGRVLRTANLVLQSNPTIKRLIGNASGGGAGGGGKPVDAGTMRIRDFNPAMPDTGRSGASPFDQGADIHSGS